jgi:MFS transporter, putative metabolite:H+ symporter
MATVNAGARLDRLPATRFHRRILALIGGGMFLDGFEIYLQGGVLAAVTGLGFSTPAQNANFLSATFAGMVIGAWFAGLAGDWYGRRFSYQINLLVFGLASLAGAAAPSMDWLIVARFVMGIGLGAEIVVGYVTLSEFMPPASRGRWGAGLAVCTNSALFVSAVVGRAVIPTYGWRWMFIMVGVGALIVWYLRKGMPESPRWLEAHGRSEEAEKVLGAIEADVEKSTGRKLADVTNAPDSLPIQQTGRLTDLFSRDILARTITGSVILITLNTALYGFVAFLPSFMVRQGLTVASSLNYITLMSFGGPVGAVLGMLLADKYGRKACTVVCSFLAILFGAIYPQLSDPTLVTLTGFLLVTAIYVMVAIAWGMYVPELFPTSIRMRGAGFCNTLGRFMTILTPQITTWLFAGFGIVAVLAFVVSLLLLQAIVVMFLGIETKQQPLEALSEAMIARNKAGGASTLAAERPATS